MPQINLLSPDFRKVTKDKEAAVVRAKKAISPSEYALEWQDVARDVTLRSAACLAGCIAIGIVLSISISHKQKALGILNEKVKELSASPQEMQDLKTQWDGLEKKVKLIDDLLSRKFSWFEKLDLLAILIPDGVWLTDIFSKQEKSSARNSPSTAAGKGKTVVIDDLSRKTTIVIKGMAVAYKIQDAIVLVRDFIKNLQNNEEFAKDFEAIKLNTLVKAAIGGMDVMRFDLICETK